MESRNLPALRSLPLLPEKAILLYFCLIVYHLTSDSLKFPQISNPPFGTAYHLSPRESVSHDSQVASAPLRIVFACHPASGWHNQGSSNLKPQISILNSSRSTQPVAIARKGIRHTVRLTSDDGRGTPPLRHFEWSEAESRNPPALRSLPLLSGKAILLHFCLIFCHLISIVYILSSNFWRLTSLYPQISDPLGTSYRLSLKRGACHWIFSCCYLTISPLSKEALIQSLSAFILEFLCNARNGTTRIASYLRSPMTKQCIKILIKADSMN